MSDERAPWEQQDGEPSRWYQRFEAYRLMGPGRSLEAVWRSEEAVRSRAKRPSSTWYERSEQWQWKSRAQAWDQHLTNLAEAEQEAAWRMKIMGKSEAQARMSEFGRNDTRLFFKVQERWTENPLPSEEILAEETYTDPVLGIPRTRYKVKKVVVNMDAFVDPELSFRVREFTDSPKNGIGFKLHDAPAAIVNIGKYNGAFTEKDDDPLEDGIAFTLPADVLAPKFLDAYDDIREHGHTEYVFKGGRGSTKSSFISLALIWMIKNNPSMHAIALRQVGNTLRDSVYSQIEWAINELGLASQFKCTVSPLEIVYRPTGQTIYFRGADEPGKIKSIKPSFGYIGIAWFEELDQFHGPEAVRNIEQSAIRGGDLAYIFKSFNPPRSAANWVNKYCQIPKAGQYQHHSTYLDLGSRIRWLGRPWVEEADHLRDVNPGAYEHEYLGVANGTGGMVFENVQLRKITDEEIAEFDRILMGNDWGYYPDPWHWVKCHYDAARHTLFIFDELRMFKASNQQTYNALVNDKFVTPEDLLIADSAEPKSVADYRGYGLNCRPAEKGPESVRYSMKWLQSLTAIVIDNERAPESAQEFLNFEYERDKDDNIISEFPDANNHAIDATRYATNLIWRRRGQ